MPTRLHSDRARRERFESLYQSIEREDDLYDCAVDDDGFLAGVHTGTRDSSVVYAERIGPGTYFALLLKPSFSKRVPNPMEHLRNPGTMPERLTHCSGRVVCGALPLDDVRSPRELRAQLTPAIRHGAAETTETYQTIHNRGQLAQIYEEYVLRAKAADQS